jgi:CRP-like cAMP-binding protein
MQRRYRGGMHRPARAHTFDGLAQEIVDYALQCAQTVTVRRGQSITQQGEPALRIFVIQDGFAKMVSTSQNGHDVLVRVVGPRDVVGSVTMGDTQRNYMVTSTALCPMTAAVWSRDTALAIAERFPEIHRRINGEVTRNLEAVIDRLHTVSESRVSQRLARALLELGERHGEPDPIGVRIVPPMTRRDIAAIVDTTPFTVSRVLSEWEDQGLIQSSRARVRLRSLEGLRLLATEGVQL